MYGNSYLYTQMYTDGLAMLLVTNAGFKRPHNWLAIFCMVGGARCLYNSNVKQIEKVTYHLIHLVAF